MASWLKFLLLFVSIQLPSHALVEVRKLFPMGAQKGSQTELVFEGSNFKFAKDILFYKEGIKLDKMELEENKLKVKISVSADAETGLHPFRVLGEDGLSNMRYIHIAPYPEIVKTSKNISFDEAFELTVPCSVNARLTNRFIDHYRIKLKKGQQITASLKCLNLAIGFYDCQIKIFDKNQKQIAFNDDSLLLKQDPMINFTAPYEGDYYLQVHDYRFGDGEYRLHLAPVLNAIQVFPAGSEANKSEKLLCFYGDEITTEKTITVKEGMKQILLDQNSVHHVPFHVSHHKNFFDQEKGYEKDKATHCPDFPLALNGRLDQKQDVDWFSFKAPKDGQVEIQVLARQLRSPLDALLEFYNKDGKLIKRQDDSGSLDPKMISKVKKDETYFVKIRDFNKNYSHRSIYRILIDYQKPQLKFTLNPSQQRTHKGQLINISPDSNRLVIFDLNRENANSAIDYSFSNLPQALTYKVLAHPEKSNKIPVLFTLKKDSKLWSTHLSAQVKNAEVKDAHYKESLIMLMGPNNKEYRHYRGETLATASTIAAPYSVEIVKNTSPMPRFGNHISKIRVHRKESFKGEVTIKAKSVLPGLSMRDQIKIPADKNEIDYSIQASSDTPLGKWPFVFDAISKHEGKDFNLSSNSQEIDIQEHYFDLKMKQYSLQRGQEREITVDITARKTPQFPIKATLLGLPNGIKAEPIEINKIDKTLTFKISASESANIGYHRNGYIRFDFTHNGHQLNQNLRCNGTIYVPKPKKKKSS